MHKHILKSSALAFTLLAAQPAFADAETEALRKQIKALEARLEQLEKKQTHAAPAPAKKLEQRLAIVERKQEVAQEIADSKKSPTVDLTLGKGLAVTSPDGQYSLRLRGFVQADSRTFFDNSSTGNTNQFLLRSVRPVLEAKLTDMFSAKLQYDVNANTVTDAYADAKLDPRFNLRIGKLKLPLGLERWQSETDLISVERGQTNNLVPDRDIGVMAFGQIVPDQLEYHLALTNGSPDLINPTSNADDNLDVTGRLFAHPFGADAWLNGLGLGLAGSYGKHLGSSTTSNLTDGYRTPAQARWFTYGTGVFADGAKWRLNPQAYYYRGSLGILGEYIVNSQEVRRTTTHATLDNRAWFTAATYVLTGEDASLEGVKPAQNFDLKKGTWGAFELVARYGQLRVDDDAFPLYASAASSAAKASEAIAGINWYFNPAVKLQSDFAWTRFNAAAGGIDREDEKLLRTRTQFRF